MIVPCTAKLGRKRPDDRSVRMRVLYSAVFVFLAVGPLARGTDDDGGGVGGPQVRYRPDREIEVRSRVR